MYITTKYSDPPVPKEEQYRVGSTIKVKNSETGEVVQEFIVVETDHTNIKGIVLEEEPPRAEYLVVYEDGHHQIVGCVALSYAVERQDFLIALPMSELQRPKNEVPSWFVVWMWVLVVLNAIGLILEVAVR
jgi:hypothetical protein